MRTILNIILVSFTFNIVSPASLRLKNTDDVDNAVAREQVTKNVDSNNSSKSVLARVLENFNLPNTIEDSLIKLGLKKKKMKKVVPKITYPVKENPGDIENQYWYTCYIACEGCIRCRQCINHCFKLYEHFFAGGDDYEWITFTDGEIIIYDTSDEESEESEDYYVDDESQDEKSGALEENYHYDMYSSGSDSGSSEEDNTPKPAPSGSEGDENKNDSNLAAENDDANVAAQNDDANVAKDDAAAKDNADSVVTKDKDVDTGDTADNAEKTDVDSTGEKDKDTGDTAADVARRDAKT